MPVSIQNIPSTEQLRDSRPKINANFDALKAASDAQESAITSKANTADVNVALSQKSPVGHTHGISEIANLQENLDAKAPSSHTHSIANVSGLQAALDGKRPLVDDVTAQTTTTRTLAATDAGDLIRCNNGSAIAVTVPTNTTVPFAIGTEIALSQQGAGQVTVVAASGVTINTPITGVAVKTRVQHSVIGIKKVDTDTWLALGDLATS